MPTPSTSWQYSTTAALEREDLSPVTGPWFLMTSGTVGPESKEGALGTGLGATGGNRMGTLTRMGGGSRRGDQLNCWTAGNTNGPWVFEPLGELYG